MLRKKILGNRTIMAIGSAFYALIITVFPAKGICALDCKIVLNGISQSLDGFIIGGKKFTLVNGRLELQTLYTGGRWNVEPGSRGIRVDPDALEAQGLYNGGSWGSGYRRIKEVGNTLEIQQQYNGGSWGVESGSFRIVIVDRTLEFQWLSNGGGWVPHSRFLITEDEPLDLPRPILVFILRKLSIVKSQSYVPKNGDLKWDPNIGYERYNARDREWYSGSFETDWRNFWRG